MNCEHCTTELTEINFDTATSNNYITLPISLQRDDVLCEEPFSYSELRPFLSIHLGRLFGKVCDTIFYKYNVNNKVNISTITSPLLTEISVNDFRYILVNEFFSGMLQSSYSLRQILTNLSETDIIFANYICFEPLAMFIINSGMMSHFLCALKVEGIEHSQLTDPKKISNLLFMGLYKFLHEHTRQIINNIISYKFKNDSITMMTAILPWILNLLIIYNSTFNLPMVKLKDWSEKILDTKVL